MRNCIHTIECDSNPVDCFALTMFGIYKTMIEISEVNAHDCFYETFRSDQM